MYAITGKGQYVGDQINDLVFDDLREAVNTNDFGRYKTIVDNNANVFNGIPHDFWLELFSGGSRPVILFWLHYPNRRLSIHDLGVISIENDDLFQLGIQRADLNMENYEGVVDALQDWSNHAKDLTDIEKALFKNRLQLINNKVALHH